MHTRAEVTTTIRRMRHGGRGSWTPRPWRRLRKVVRSPPALYTQSTRAAMTSPIPRRADRAPPLEDQAPPDETLPTPAQGAPPRRAKCT